jgi:hypothetical protein
VKLWIWLYTHRHGVDVLKILAPDNVTEMTEDQVIRSTGINWEGDDESMEEWLESDGALPVGDDVSALQPFCSEFKAR